MPVAIVDDHRYGDMVVVGVLLLQCAKFRRVFKVREMSQRRCGAGER